MIKKTFILLTLLAIVINCYGQNKYYKPKGIVNKTKYYQQDSSQWVTLNDKERVDGYTRIGDSIFGGEIACNIEPLKGIDVATFKVWPGTKYAKDKNHVYYPLSILCDDYVDCGVCFYSKIIIKGANPETFRYLGKEYASDGENAYYRGELVKEADGKTFKVIEGPEFFCFAIDKNHVYKRDKIFSKADPVTFYYDKDDKRNIDTEFEHKYIIGDKNKEWKFVPPNSIKRVIKR